MGRWWVIQRGLIVHARGVRWSRRVRAEIICYFRYAWELPDGEFLLTATFVDVFCEGGRRGLLDTRRGDCCVFRFVAPDSNINLLYWFSYFHYYSAFFWSLAFRVLRSSPIARGLPSLTRPASFVRGGQSWWLFWFFFFLKSTKIARRKSFWDSIYFECLVQFYCYCREYQVANNPDHNWWFII